MQRKSLWIGLAALVLSASALAGSAASERRTIFKQYKQDLTAMHRMTSGGSFDQAQFLRLATSFNDAAHKPWQYFPAGSQSRDSKAEIWSRPAEFKQAVDNFTTASGKLVQVAGNGDVGQVRAQLNLVQKTCKACHDSFRN